MRCEELEALKEKKRSIRDQVAELRRARKEFDSPLPDDPVELLLGQEPDTQISDAQRAASQVEREIHEEIERHVSRCSNCHAESRSTGTSQ
jgi:predicted  nucleic acid-binding Zn-ribbon protein